MTVAPEAFTQEMNQRWVSLGNTPSDALRSLWREIANILNQQILANDFSHPSKIKVIQAETGTGKTQGLALYCSKLPANTGVLIVTRMKQQANELAELINHLSDKDIAVARHGDNSLSVEQMSEYQVLVITHKAYEMSLDLINKGQDSAFTNIMAWKAGQRRLTVIDEALDAVKISQVELDELTRTIGYIPFQIKLQFPRQLDALEKLRTNLEEISLAQQEHGGKGIIVRDDALSNLDDYDMTKLRKAIRGLEWDKLINGYKSAKIKSKLATRIDKTLLSAQATAENWIYYAKEGKHHSVNTSSCILPPSFRNAVILDATASSNLIYELLGCVDVPTLPKARNYSNVTLNVKRVQGTGKGTMINKKESRCQELIEYLRENVQPDSSVLVCCHLDLEATILSYSMPFHQFDVAHWGALDGRNTWHEYDTVVVFGLPHLSSKWPLLTYSALQGLPSQAWLEDKSERRFRRHKDVSRALSTGHLVTSTIQAINRVRSRRVIDEDGNCLPTKVYILLPEGKDGDDILTGICKEMPSIDVQLWGLDLDASVKRRTKPSQHHRSFLKHMQNMGDGEVSVKEVCEELKVPKRSYERLVQTLKSKSGQLYDDLCSLGVALNIIPQGRGVKLMLVKELS